MEKQIIWRGLLAGVIAGVLAFVFARIFVAPQTQSAIDFEDGVAEARAAMDPSAAEGGMEMFTRSVQVNVGMAFAIVGFSIAIGALFAVAYAVALGRVGNVSPRVLSLYVAGGMLVSLYVVPFLKYPTNPPAVGSDETVKQRSALYLLMVVVSVVLFVAAVYLGRRLNDRLGAWNATVVAGGAYIAAIAVVMLVLPTISETPEPLRDAAAVTGHADDLSTIGVDASAPPDPTRDWDAGAFRAAVPGPHFDPELKGTAITSTADVVSSAPELARMTLNIAATHHDSRIGGQRLVYGGHTIGLALAQASRVLPNLATVLAWESCDHTGPVFEGDTLYSEVHVEGATALSGGRGGVLRLRSLVFAAADEPRRVLDWRFSALQF